MKVDTVVAIVLGVLISAIIYRCFDHILQREAQYKNINPPEVWVWGKKGPFVDSSTVKVTVIDKKNGWVLIEFKDGSTKSISWDEFFSQYEKYSEQ